MTQNQIAYWNLQELKRSNLMKEAQNQQSVDEVKRSNLAKEQETHRSNVARETETNRSNLVNEQLKADIQDAQKQRYATQNSVDIVNALTGGVKNVLGGIGSIIG